MKILIAALFVASVACLYKEKGSVVLLNETNFKTLVLDSDDLWLVEFYGKFWLTQLHGADIASHLRLIGRRLPRILKELSRLALST
jgi:hypothetical protein